MSSRSSANSEILRVSSFREKPCLQVAREYIKDNSFHWNAGIFVWNVNTIVKAFREFCPSISGIFESIDVYGTEKEQEEIDRKFPMCDNISVDYAIMEKAKDIFVYPADFGWSDLGTWGSLLQLSPKDADGNSVIGSNVSLFDTRNCIVHTLNNNKIVVQGLDGYIVAEGDGKILICKLSEEQRIKEFSGE